MGEGNAPDSDEETMKQMEMWMQEMETQNGAGSLAICRMQRRDQAFRVSSIYDHAIDLGMRGHNDDGSDGTGVWYVNMCIMFIVRLFVARLLN